MKIGTQDGSRILEFGEVQTVCENNGRISVYISDGYKGRVLAGNYIDYDRGRGVMYEIGLAYRNKERIFYMPAE